MKARIQAFALLVAALMTVSIVISIFVSLLFDSRARSQERRFSADDTAFHLALSQMCANEAFHSRADCLLIFQATRRHGTTSAERLAWLRDHSNCVLVETPPRSMRGNCRWTRTLTLSDSRPSGWDTRRDGTWEGVNQRQWARVRELTAILVRGGRPRGGWPCHIDPDTWAGRETDAQRIAGLPPTSVPLRCTDPLNRERPTRNEGFRTMSLESRARYESRFVDIHPEQNEIDRD